MKTHLLCTLLIVTMLAMSGAAANACTVKYKAKRDNPLKLEAGSLSLPPSACQSKSAAAAAASAALQQQGWTLLAITAILP